MYFLATPAERDDTLVAEHTQHPDHASSTLSNKRIQGSLEKWLILGLKQEIHKMSLEHLVVRESELVLKTKQNPQLWDVRRKDTGAK